jgi:hypothetical protein
MNIYEILQKVQFGNPVAELDEDLPNYFLITNAFKHLTSGKYEIIAGDKGTGKTAIYQHLQYSYKKIPELRGVEVIAGFNLSGEPLFRRLGDESKLTEGQYITIWKMYFLSLAGNWLIKNSRGQKTPTLTTLSNLLSKIGLLSIDDSAGSVFSRLMGWLRLNAMPKSLGVDFSFNEYGIPVFSPKVELGKADSRETVNTETISHQEAFSILNTALAERNIILWIALDRLDEAFVGRPDIETLALRALIRTFMDMSFTNLRLKLFVRNDLFRKITREGFVNLTHVHARRKEIRWDDEDLLAVIAQRIRNNSEVFRMIGFNVTRASNKQIFNMMFPYKVYTGPQAPTTWNWMMNQIRDGNYMKPPRNLIDLCIMAQEEQLRHERHGAREYAVNIPIIEPEALKRAAAQLSTQRIEDTLMAEYGEDVKTAIKAFRNGKAEHNEQTLAEIFGMDVVAVRLIAKVLTDIGFLEEAHGVYKVPPLYRPGLNITKGKAFNNYH